ncbi:MAG: peptidoglycan DD-metalloendopeptidase family protein [Patescibacteria group bacterium]|nr:peptidoglycan DD-metalloendopeptidase family protein [Patescibacteria group bacterium]MDD4304556.1 peptidoglycan DD-metalloendopeptidase family protein [Patescibacteria group bacterium]MDD4695743.1 peptidoglycan DD-metalloendopeptidase family protein [Patescibacteria group bacterium]
MKTRQFVLVAIFTVAFGMNSLWSDDHIFTLPVAGNDIKVNHAWYYDQNVGGGLHRAIDYTSNQGSGIIEGRDVLSAYGGVVSNAINNVPNNTGIDYGNYVKIDHGNGYETLYGHMLFGSVPVNVGDYVHQGQTIGNVGNTGNSTGPHLHFELIYNGEKVDPYGWYSYPGPPYPNCNPEEYYWTESPPVHSPNIALERLLPDDLIVHVTGTPDYYRIEDNLMRHIPSENVFHSWGFNWDEAVEITQDEFSDFAQGADLEVMVGACVYDQNYQRWIFDYASNTSNVIVKRKIDNWQALNYSIDVWIPVTNIFMFAFNQGADILSVSDYPYGTVLQNQNNLSERYVLVKGSAYGYQNQKVKLPLLSNDVYNINYYHHNFNVPVSSSVLSSYPTVTNSYSTIIDGKLISGSGDETYYLENGYKRHILDNTSFSYYGFNFANVQSVDDVNINNFPSGPDLFFSPSGGPEIYIGEGLDDGNFDSGITSYWNFNDWQNIADFQVNHQDVISGFYSASINIQSAVNYYDVELKQLVSVESEFMYHCSFWAKANSTSSITLTLQNDISPWNNYGLWKEITLSNNWRRYQYMFNCSDTDDLARLSFMLGSCVSNIQIDCVVFEKVENIPPTEGNLLLNADFELGHYATWTIEDHNLSAVYYVDFESCIDEYSLFVDPNQNAFDYQVQLLQCVDVVSGMTYYLSFYARAESNRTIRFNLYNNGAPWNNYGLWQEVVISTEWNLYQVQFVATQSGRPRFSMNFGDQDVALWIDNIRISNTVSNSDNCIYDTQITFSNYPNPFNPETRIEYSIPTNRGELIIYNIKGQVVKRSLLSNKNSSFLWNGSSDDGEKVGSGVYFYTIKCQNYSTSIKKMVLVK